MQQQCPPAENVLAAQARTSRPDHQSLAASMPHHQLSLQVLLSFLCIGIYLRYACGRIGTMRTVCGCSHRIARTIGEWLPKIRIAWTLLLASQHLIPRPLPCEPLSMRSHRQMVDGSTMTLKSRHITVLIWNDLSPLNANTIRTTCSTLRKA